MSFETALTGLKAATADLDVTGNNIANSSTVGFKGSRAEFADIFATTNLGVSANAVGQGVRLANVRQQFGQGQLDFTGSSLDLAINGPGFFKLDDGGETVYSRAGAFQLDADGHIVNSSGQRLVGQQARNGTLIGTEGPLQVANGDIAPQATGTADEPISITANLDANAEKQATAWLQPDGSLQTWDHDSNAATAEQPRAPTQLQPEDYNFSTSTTVYDSLGRGHLMTWYFRATDDGAGGTRWEVLSGLDGESNPQNMTGTAVTFTESGSLATINGQDIATNGAQTAEFTLGVGPEANPIQVGFDLAGLTQYGTPFSVNRISQNGYSAGQFSGLNVEADGKVVARYTNGKSQTMGQIQLTRFPSPENLQEIGGTSWVETFAAGTPVSHTPGESGVGSLESGALEQSNVDITEQLVKMISAQRNYSANSQMISTQDQITREILNIRG